MIGGPGTLIWIGTGSWPILLTLKAARAIGPTVLLRPVFSCFGELLPILIACPESPALGEGDYCAKPELWRAVSPRRLGFQFFLYGATSCSKPSGNLMFSGSIDATFAFLLGYRFMNKLCDFKIFPRLFLKLYLSIMVI